MTTSCVLTYDDVPRSLNAQNRKGHFAYYHEKKRWQGIFAVGLMSERVPRGLKSVQASAVLQFPVRRKRDEGNFRFFLEKALGDALTAGGWLADDTPDQYRFGTVEFAAEPGSKQTVITLQIERD